MFQDTPGGSCVIDSDLSEDGESECNESDPGSLGSDESVSVMILMEDSNLSPKEVLINDGSLVLQHTHSKPKMTELTSPGLIKLTDVVIWSFNMFFWWILVHALESAFHYFLFLSEFPLHFPLRLRGFF